MEFNLHLFHYYISTFTVESQNVFYLPLLFFFKILYCSKLQYGCHVYIVHCSLIHSLIHTYLKKYQKKHQTEANDLQV